MYVVHIKKDTVSTCFKLRSDIIANALRNDVTCFHLFTKLASLFIPIPLHDKKLSGEQTAPVTDPVATTARKKRFLLTLK